MLSVLAPSSSEDASWVALTRLRDWPVAVVAVVDCTALAAFAAPSPIEYEAHFGE